MLRAVSGVRGRCGVGDVGAFCSRLAIVRFLWSLSNSTSSHGEGDEEGGGARGPGDEEGHAARDEGPEGHEVSRGLDSGSSAPGIW